MPFRCEGESVTAVVHDSIPDSSWSRYVDPACSVAQGRQPRCGSILHRAPCSVLPPQRGWLYGGGRADTRCRQGGTMPLLAGEPVKGREAASSDGGGWLGVRVGTRLCAAR